MFPTSVVAIFCDDIREEKSGQITLVGVLGDNINVGFPPDRGDGSADSKFVRVIPRLGIYIRINFDASAELGPTSLKITMPDGEVIHEAMVEESVVATARSTREKGNALAGIIQRIQFGGVPLRQLGRLTVEVTIGQQAYLAGYLNFLAE